MNCHFLPCPIRNFTHLPRPSPSRVCESVLSVVPPFFSVTSRAHTLVRSGANSKAFFPAFERRVISDLAFILPAISTPVCAPVSKQAAKPKAFLDTWPFTLFLLGSIKASNDCADFGSRHFSLLILYRMQIQFCFRYHFFKL